MVASHLSKDQGGKRTNKIKTYKGGWLGGGKLSDGAGRQKVPPSSVTLRRLRPSLPTMTAAKRLEMLGHSHFFRSHWSRAPALLGNPYLCFRLGHCRVTRVRRINTWGTKFISLVAVVNKAYLLDFAPIFQNQTEETDWLP